MTLAPSREDQTTGAPAAAPLDRSRLGRLLGPVPATRRRWVAATLLLAIVLGGILMAIDNGQVVDADEGAALVQAQLVHRTGQWSMRSDQQIDPTGRWFPVHLSTQVDDHWFPFTNSPLDAMVVRVLYDAGGLKAVLGLQTLGLLLTALGAGLLTERLRPGRGIQAMWLTGALSPLLFDGYWAIAHTVAAAGAVWATLAAVHLIRDRRVRWLPVAVAALAVAVVFRHEGVLFSSALAVGLLTCATRSRWRWPVALSAGSMVIGVAGIKAMNLLQRHVQGGTDTSLYRPGYQGGWLSGRITSFRLTMLHSGFTPGVGTLLSFLAAILIIGAVLSTRTSSIGPGVTRILAIGGAVAAVARLMAPVDLVPGLFMAAPLIVAAAFLVPREAWSELRFRLVGVTAVVGYLAVLATQATQGGGGEWGGRYFHLVLPLLCVLAVVGMDALLTRQPALGRLVIACGLIASLALSVLAIDASRAGRVTAETLTETTWQQARHTASAREPGGPVIVTTWVAGGRFSWRHLLDGRYLTVENTSDFPELGRRLHDAGVGEFVVLLEPADKNALPKLGSDFQVERRTPLGTHGWTIAVVRDTTL